MYLILFRAFFIFSSFHCENIKKNIARTNANIHHAAISITIMANTNNIMSDIVSEPYVDVIMKIIFNILKIFN